MLVTFGLSAPAKIHTLFHKNKNKNKNMSDYKWQTAGKYICKPPAEHTTYFTNAPMLPNFLKQFFSFIPRPLAYSYKQRGEKTKRPSIITNFTAICQRGKNTHTYAYTWKMILGYILVAAAAVAGGEVKRKTRDIICLHDANVLMQFHALLSQCVHKSIMSSRGGLSISRCSPI